MLSKNAPCPCGSGKKAKGCCARYHAGEPAPSPEALMRSRYTAYATGACAYLAATTHPSGPHWRADHAAWLDELRRYCRAVRFEGLTVLHASESGDHGEVAFQARLSHDGRDVSFAEHSRFVREGGRWYYVDAV